MNCIIVDDELSCIDTLETILKMYCPKLNISGKAQNIEAAVQLINLTSPQLVFLDVEIGSETGFDLFNFFSEPEFEVVFTTAHEKYALKAIKSSCYDFLLKPVIIQEVVNVVAKLEKDTKMQTGRNVDVLLENLKSQNNLLQKIAVPSNDGYAFINVNDIISLEADGKYTKIVTQSGLKSLSTKNIGEFEELLSNECFFRTHKSWIVNLNHVKKYLKSESMVQLSNETTAEVSFRKKDEFIKLFNKV